ncbi:hypothetical protein Gocc_2933 [Gaiella occulta]|uniref:Uncharacterized protein n=1 Tax=Gaiella occulta TaxID=1002870 RepID=A0A7M2YTA9_9ACTN|nr:hypothetical protein [Gaiella occulta]RDI73333.1 hypothetical protein Gocc_2933 [Gaiella occulta]
MTAPVRVTLEREHLQAIGNARYMLAVLEQLGLDVRRTIDDLDEIVSAARAAMERVERQEWVGAKTDEPGRFCCGGYVFAWDSGQHSVRVDRLPKEGA